VSRADVAGAAGVALLVGAVMCAALFVCWWLARQDTAAELDVADQPAEVLTDAELQQAHAENFALWEDELWSARNSGPVAARGPRVQCNCGRRNCAGCR
jgi:hypothetical protein